MPLASEILPSIPTPLEFTFKSKTRSKVTQATSGKIISRRYGGQWYELTLQYPPMDKSEFGPIVSFLEELGGKNGIFYVEIPPVTDQAGNVVGNMANYSNDTKLHRITSTGTFPDGRNVGGILVTDPVYLRCSLKNDVQAVRHSKDGFTRFELDLVERI